MGACSERGVDLAFFSPQGKFLARVVGKTQGNVLLRQQQYRAADDPFASCRYAKGFLLGKVYNARWVLERANPRPSPARPGGKAKSPSPRTLPLLCQTSRTQSPWKSCAVWRVQLRSSTLDGFDSLILQQHDTFAFAGRNRRPPLDPINALLSFSYTLLARDCAAALEGVGLDPYVGFLHRPRPGRASLALDMMEELRAVYADRFVLTCVNQKMITTLR